MNDPFFKQIQELADGKLKCECGNADWRQFLFVSSPEAVIAGCKKCTAIHIGTERGWVLRTRGL